LYIFTKNLQLIIYESWQCFIPLETVPLHGRTASNLILNPMLQ
jgi:hypothetical protein